MPKDLHLSLNKIYRTKFEKLTEIKGVSMSELIRRWIDEKYNAQIESGKRLEELISSLQQDTTKQGLGNIFHDKKTGQILKEDGSFQEINISKL